jgi:Zn-dependent protease/predicted transcriptional regulator
MRGSLQIGTFAGIGVFIHWTFFLIFGYVAWVNWTAGASGILLASVFILALFFCVVLHEFGHALTARRYGIGTRDITLLPIGGVARLERMPEDPTQELLVALAGPAVNVVIALLLLAYMLATGTFPEQLSMPPEPTMAALIQQWGFPFMLLYVNVFLVVFNMLPAFPMDGGRVLRALLGYRLNYARATRIAGATGQIMAVLFFFFGLVTVTPLLMLIAVFVFLGAQAETQLAELRWGLSGIPVRDAMITRFVNLSTDDSLGNAIDHLLDGSQQDFAVMDADRIVGVLSRSDMLTALATKGPATLVGDVMRRDCAAVDENEVLFRVFQRMQEKSCPIVPVTRRGQVVGMITLENVGELLMVRSALRQAAANTQQEPGPGEHPLGA